MCVPNRSLDNLRTVWRGWGWVHIHWDVNLLRLATSANCIYMLHAFLAPGIRRRLMFKAESMGNARQWTQPRLALPIKLYCFDEVEWCLHVGYRPPTWPGGGAARMTSTMESPPPRGGRIGESGHAPLEQGDTWASQGPTRWHVPIVSLRMVWVRVHPIAAWGNVTDQNFSHL